MNIYTYCFISATQTIKLFILSALLLFLGLSDCRAVTLSGTYTVGVGGNYTTLSAAVADYNAATLAGAVVFNLTDTAYSSSETFPITINTNTSASAANTLTIKPVGSATITGSNETAIIVLNGARYISINGLNNLTIHNSNTTSSGNSGFGSAVIYLQNDASYDTIQNCIISNGRNCILNAGKELGINTNNVITANSIKNFSYSGVFDMGYSTGLVISNNSIFQTNIPETTGSKIGINMVPVLNVYRPYTSSGWTINGNKIYGFQNTLDGTAIYGIYAFETGSAKCNISNNMISIGTDGENDSSSYVAGIYLYNEIANPIDVFFNTVQIAGTYAGVSPVSSAALLVQDSGVVAKNNIFGNIRTGAGGGGMYQYVYDYDASYLYYDFLPYLHIAVVSIAPYAGDGLNATWISDYNDVYNDATKIQNYYALSYWSFFIQWYNQDYNNGYAYASWDDWAADTAGYMTIAPDVHSLHTGASGHQNGIAPIFANAGVGDLHLTTAAANCYIKGQGIAGSGVTTDYEGEVRSTGTSPGGPDMGADEFGATINCTVGIIEDPLTNAIFLYPNPVRNELRIKNPAPDVTGSESGIYKIRIYNMLGEEISAASLSFGESRGEAIIDVSVLSPGVYFIRVDDEGGRQVKRFVKE